MTPKKILILGGTQFVGRLLVSRLITMPQYDVTLFNRGKSNAGLFPDVKLINGDRETDDYLKISQQNWDCIIDFSGYYPLTFDKLLTSLRGKVKKYIFMSTISVFDLTAADGRVITEDDPILDCTTAKQTSALPDGYGEKKAEMERMLARHTDMETVMLRPSFLYGPYDVTDRFYYWLYQVVHHAEILVPEADYPFSLTYARDLVQILLAAIDSTPGNRIYHTISHRRSTLREALTIASGILQRSPDLIPLSEAGQRTYGLGYGSFPLYRPFSFEISGERCLTNYHITPISFEDGIRATLAYGDSIGWPVPKVGLQAEKQAEIIRAVRR